MVRPCALTLLALALLLAAWAAPAVTAVSTDTPLRVDALRLTGAPPSWTLDKGCSCWRATDATVSLTVVNAGPRASSGYRVTYEWVPDGGAARPMNEDAARSTDIGDPLQPGASHTHTTAWRLQADGLGAPGEVGPGTLRATVSETSNVQGSLGLFLASHAFAVQVAGAAQTIGPDGVGFWPIRLSNQGNVPETFTLRESPVVGGEPAHRRVLTRFLPGGQDVLCPSDDSPCSRLAGFIVPSGGTAEVRLRARYAFLDDTSDFDLSERVDATMTSIPGDVRSFTLGALHVRHGGAPARTDESLRPAQSATLFAAAEQPTAAPFRLQNLGSANQDYALSGQAGGGWQDARSAVNGTSSDEVVLASGEVANLSVVATAPHAAAGTASTFSLAATPIRPEGTPLAAQAAVRLHGPAPVVLPLRLGTSTAYAGDELTAVVNVANVGDQGMVETAALRATLRQANGATTTRQAEVPVLQQGQSTTLLVPLAAIPQATTATLTASIVSGPDDPVVLPFVVHRAALAVLPPEPLDGLPGELVSYRAAPHAFAVRNDGDRAENITLAIGQGVGVLDGSMTFLLAAGETRLVGLRHAVPEHPGAALAAAITLRATLAEAPSHGNQATVATSVRDAQAPVVRWNASLPDAWKPNHLAVGQASATDDTAVQRAWVTVRNATGERLIALPGSGPWPVALNLSAGIFNITVHAIDVHGNVGATAPHLLTIASDAPPQVVDARVEGNATVGYTVVARILSVRPLAEATLIVDGNASPLPATEGPLRVPVTLAAGNHTIAIQARDVDGHASLAQVQVQVPATATGPAAASSATRGSPSLGAPVPGIAFLLAAIHAARRPQRRPQGG